MSKRNVETSRSPGNDRAMGPFVVLKSNPRYFTVRSKDGEEQQALDLTGSHIYNNFHDGTGPGEEYAEMPEQLYLAEYLKCWAHFRSQAAGGSFHLCMTPQPRPRTRPGLAKDGRPNFNLERTRGYKPR